LLFSHAAFRTLTCARRAVVTVGRTCHATGAVRRFSIAATIAPAQRFLPAHAAFRLAALFFEPVARWAAYAVLSLQGSWREPGGFGFQRACGGRAAACSAGGTGRSAARRRACTAAATPVARLSACTLPAYLALPSYLPFPFCCYSMQTATSGFPLCWRHSRGSPPPHLHLTNFWRRRRFSSRVRRFVVCGGRCRCRPPLPADCRASVAFTLSALSTRCVSFRGAAAYSAHSARDLSCLGLSSCVSWNMTGFAAWRLRFVLNML